MPHDASTLRLTGHALRNAHLRERALERARAAPPLAKHVVQIRAQMLGMTRLECARRSGLSRGTLRDLELGIHLPTRRVLQQFVAFCQQNGVAGDHLEELRRLYAGLGDTLEQFIARLELRAGSPRELARRVGISPTTLWEYRRGNFPLSLALLKKLCAAVDENPAPAESLWRRAEFDRLRSRGYPEPLAEFWVHCARAGCSESHLIRMGMTMATVRRLRYLEVPTWQEVAAAAKRICAAAADYALLEECWRRYHATHVEQRAAFGIRLQQLRKKQGVSRRELADLFHIGGKKPARIIKYIEEDGFHSTQAYPAGLAALFARDDAERDRLLSLWRERRRQFHRRHRPEMRVDLRLAREMYGLELKDMEPILGYSSLEYQRIERGICPLQNTAHERIVVALHTAGRERVSQLLQLRCNRDADRTLWLTPSSLPEMIALLARREGGLIPLTRMLRNGNVRGLWAGRLRAMIQGADVPPWPVIDQIGAACGVSDMSQVRLDWEDRFRAQIRKECTSPLGVEVRLLIAEVAMTLRDFSPRLGFNYSVLVRDMQRIDRDQPLKWFHVERILKARGLTSNDDRWREIHGLWNTMSDRQRKPTPWRAAVS